LLKWVRNVLSITFLNIFEKEGSNETGL
jgi:hypothetical protein